MPYRAPLLPEVGIEVTFLEPLNSAGVLPLPAAPTDITFGVTLSRRRTLWVAPRRARSSLVPPSAPAVAVVSARRRPQMLAPRRARVTWIPPQGALVPAAARRRPQAPVIRRARVQTPVPVQAAVVAPPFVPVQRSKRPWPWLSRARLGHPPWVGLAPVPPPPVVVSSGGGPGQRYPPPTPPQRLREWEAQTRWRLGGRKGR
jgi:hypothetical protein